MTPNTIKSVTIDFFFYPPCLSETSWQVCTEEDEESIIKTNEILTTRLDLLVGKILYILQQSPLLQEAMALLVGFKENKFMNPQNSEPVLTQKKPLDSIRLKRQLVIDCVLLSTVSGRRQFL